MLQKPTMLCFPSPGPHLPSASAAEDLSMNSDSSCSCNILPQAPHLSFFCLRPGHLWLCGSPLSQCLSPDPKCEESTPLESGANWWMFHISQVDILAGILYTSVPSHRSVSNKRETFADFTYPIIIHWLTPVCIGYFSDSSPLRGSNLHFMRNHLNSV